MITIKQATIKDIKDIQKLNHKIMFRNVEYDGDININFDLQKAGYKFFKEAVKNPRGCFFIAYDGDEMIGYANGGLKRYCYRNKKYFEIENVGVIPEYKRKGIGRRLLQELTRWAKKKGAQRLYLNCYIRNKEALSFYKRLGFKEIDVSLERDL